MKDAESAAQPVAVMPEDRQIPAEAGLCPLDLPVETVIIRRYNDVLVVTVASGEPSLVDELRRRARVIGDSGYYTPASAYQDPDEREDGELPLDSEIRVRVNQEDLDYGVRLVLHTQNKQDADTLERQLESDMALLQADRCELPATKLSISSHTRVRLRATVAPVAASPYRVEGDVAFTVVDELPRQLSVDVPELA